MNEEVKTSRIVHQKHLYTLAYHNGLPDAHGYAFLCEEIAMLKCHPMFAEVIVRLADRFGDQRIVQWEEELRDAPAYLWHLREINQERNKLGKEAPHNVWKFRELGYEREKICANAYVVFPGIIAYYFALINEFDLRHDIPDKGMVQTAQTGKLGLDVAPKNRQQGEQLQMEGSEAQ